MNIKCRRVLKTLILAFSLISQCLASDTIPVVRTEDFRLDGKGSATAWQQAAWQHMPIIDTGKSDYSTRFRIMYSSKGIYLLFHGTDHKITSPYRKDFEDIYNADVFEAFFHTAPSLPAYFEYEISPRNKELVLIIPNFGGKFFGWAPWKYDGERKTIKKVSIQRENGRVQGWMAEIFIPFALLEPLKNSPPQKGSIWNANFCRLDYDSGKMVKWAWSPILRGFHEYERYRSIRFE